MSIIICSAETTPTFVLMLQLSPELAQASDLLLESATEHGGVLSWRLWLLLRSSAAASVTCNHAMINNLWHFTNTECHHSMIKTLWHCHQYLLSTLDDQQFVALQQHRTSPLYDQHIVALPPVLTVIP